eukprot:242682_1
MSNTYLLEKLPHLKQLKLFFKPTFAPNRYHMTIQDYFVVFVRKDKKEDFIKICFDCQIDKDKTTCNIQNKTVFLTLPIIQDEYNDETDDFPTANELNITKYSLIKCKFCENIIYNHSSSNNLKLTKIYPLPSEYWLELSDIWFCCQSHQIDFNAQEIRAKQNALLMGKLFIILHSNNIHSKSIKLSPRIIDDEYSVNALSENEKQRIDNKKNHKHNGHNCTTHKHNNLDEKYENNNDLNDTSWDGVQAFNCYCNRCETLLGMSYKTIENINNNSEILNEFHLCKFELNIENGYKIPYARNMNKMDNIYYLYCIENYFSTKMLETKKARMVHKFLIYDYNYSIFLKVNIMSTKCFIKCPLLIKDSECKKMAPVLKLLYVDVSNKGFDENNEWMKKQNGHLITSSTENCMLLLECLDRYNKLYPEMIQTQKFAMNMKLTFLRLLSRTWM